MRISDWSSDVCSSDLRRVDEAHGLGRIQLLLGLPLEARLADEDRQHQAGAAEPVVAGHLRRAAAADQFAIGLERTQPAGAEPGLVAAAEPRGDGVAVGAGEAIPVARPGRTSPSL